MVEGMRYAGRLEPGKRYGGGSQKLQPQNHPRWGVRMVFSYISSALRRNIILPPERK